MYAETPVYFDTGLATDMRHLKEPVESVHSGDYDVATGSRWLSKSQADRSVKRAIPSVRFGMIVQTVLCSELKDHQCGFKAVSRTVLEQLSSHSKDEHWF